MALEVSCRVLLDDIAVMADIGALASERGMPQPLRLHVALTVVPPGTDELPQTFDYVAIRTAARALARERIVLIETFAYRLALACLASDAVLAADVRIEKPRAVPGCRAGAHVTLSRTKGGRPGADRRASIVRRAGP